MRNYVRLKFIAIDAEERIVWAEKLQSDGDTKIYSKRNKYGEGSFQREIIILLPADIIYEKPAQMNLHYGELEIAEKIK